MASPFGPVSAVLNEVLVTESSREYPKLQAKKPGLTGSPSYAITDGLRRLRDGARLGFGPFDCKTKNDKEERAKHQQH